eukprot:6176793-Pleurochrysis_carterae.AAC.1
MGTHVLPLPLPPEEDDEVAQYAGRHAAGGGAPHGFKAYFHVSKSIACTKQDAARPFATVAAGGDAGVEGGRGQGTASVGALRCWISLLTYRLT